MITKCIFSPLIHGLILAKNGQTSVQFSLIEGQFMREKTKDYK